MKLDRKEIFENELDWSDYVYWLQLEVSGLRSRIKKNNWDRFEKPTPYHLMIKHRLEKIFSVYYKKHKNKLNK